MCSSPAASIAPVFPAETTASASPAPTARQAATRLESGFARTASAGFSCISITSRRDDALEALRVEVLRPVEDDVDPVARRLERARDDLGRTPVSPEGVDRYPRPLRRLSRQRLDVAALVRLAVRARVMRALRAMARRALVDARRLEAMRRPALVAACLRRFLLGDGHRRASVANIRRGPSGPLMTDL